MCRTSDLKGPMLWQVRAKTDISICENSVDILTKQLINLINGWLECHSTHKLTPAPVKACQGTAPQRRQERAWPTSPCPLDPMDPMLKRRKTTSSISSMTGEASRHKPKKEPKKNWLCRYVLKIAKEFERKVLKVLEACPSYFFEALPSRTVR